jgi:glycosyltransferase involved in cell wall biosynthesis
LRAGLTVALRVVYRWARLTLTVQNSDDRAVLADLRIAPSTEVQVIAGGVGVDLDAWPACAPPDAPTVIFAIVARMLWDKGILEAVEACRLLKQRGIVCRLWLVGVPDPQNPTSITESQLTVWQDEQIVEWLGFRADIAAIWQQAHVALLPSYREGMPTALMEAAACGRPIITTDVPGCREVIDDGIEGLIVPARDAAALADAMETMVNDSVLRRRCGDAARLRAERLFDHRQVAAAYLNLYRSLMTTAHFP